MIHITMRDNNTNEVRVLHKKLEWFERGSDFMWSDGNFSCDCNRALFFYDHDIDIECGESRFAVLGIRIDDGTFVYSDDESRS